MMLVTKICTKIFGKKLKFFQIPDPINPTKPKIKT